MDTEVMGGSTSAEERQKVAAFLSGDRTQTD